MNILRCVINALVHLMNGLDKVLSFFGIRFLPLTRESILKGKTHREVRLNATLAQPCVIVGRLSGVFAHICH